jgi:mannan endo-1,4-beta-mannosidase
MNSLIKIVWKSIIILSAMSNVQAQMKVVGRHIYTQDNEKIILRGVNEMLLWSNDRIGSKVFTEIAKTGANCVRYTIGYYDGNVLSAAELAATIKNANASGMIAMPAHWAATGRWHNLQMCVDYWLQPDVIAAIKENEQFFMLNIANEGGDGKVTEADFIEGYKSAVTQLRNAGYLCPIVIDAPDWGRDYTMVLNTWNTLNDHDPLKNIMVSWHTYQDGTTEDKINHYNIAINRAVNEDIPFFLGEGPTPCDWRCIDSPYKYGMEICQENEIGWLAWSWGLVVNGDCKTPARFDWANNGVFGDWATKEGRDMAVDHPNSIKNTSLRPASLQKRASVLNK